MWLRADPMVLLITAWVFFDLASVWCSATALCQGTASYEGYENFCYSEDIWRGAHGLQWSSSGTLHRIGMMRLGCISLLSSP